MKRTFVLRTLLTLLLLPCAGFGGAHAWAQAAAKSSATAPAPKGTLLDLNSASAADLKSLPGVGDAFAKRIVEGRPYATKNQLVTRGVLPQATYDKIKDQIVARRSGKS